MYFQKTYVLCQFPLDESYNLKIGKMFILGTMYLIKMHHAMSYHIQKTAIKTTRSNTLGLFIAIY